VLRLSNLNTATISHSPLLSQGFDPVLKTAAIPFSYFGTTALTQVRGIRFIFSRTQSGTRHHLTHSRSHWHTSTLTEPIPWMWLTRRNLCHELPCDERVRLSQDDRSSVDSPRIHALHRLGPAYASSASSASSAPVDVVQRLTVVGLPSENPPPPTHTLSL